MAKEDVGTAVLLRAEAAMQSSMWLMTLSEETCYLSKFMASKG